MIIIRIFHHSNLSCVDQPTVYTPSNPLSNTAERIDVFDLTPENIKLTADFIGEYTGFTEYAIYDVVAHAQDINGLVARPVTLTVDMRHHSFLSAINRPPQWRAS